LVPDNHGLIYLPDEAFAAAFAQNASADELALLCAVQRPISPACITVPVNRPLWKDRPTWFLMAEQDRMIVRDTQRFMAERMHARVRSHPVDPTRQSLLRLASSSTSYARPSGKRSAGDRLRFVGARSGTMREQRTTTARVNDR
jgi:hypothetical protein